ncbi:MAG: hypothetical protein EOO36_24540 [Cytophagaceae bacterium]|nr:MAG: hypothetical protein EOO36_24540 [Cytophagaceae bacterium]
MLVIKSQNKAAVDEAQRQYWWAKTPQERLAVAARLIAQARQLYAANSANPVLTYGERILKSATPISRRER